MVWSRLVLNVCIDAWNLKANLGITFWKAMETFLLSPTLSCSTQDFFYRGKESLIPTGDQTIHDLFEIIDLKFPKTLQIRTCSTEKVCNATKKWMNKTVQKLHSPTLFPAHVNYFLLGKKVKMTSFVQGLSSVHIILFLVHSLFCLLSLRSGWLATQFNSFDSASARNKKEQAFYISQAWASWIRLLKRECKISSVNFHVVVWWLLICVIFSIAIFRLVKYDEINIKFLLCFMTVMDTM